MFDRRDILAASATALAAALAAGHSTYFERADVFNRLVERFLSQIG